MCIVRWFQDQEAASSCPCCRREVTPLENVPLVPEGEEDGDDEEDDDGNDEEEDDEWLSDDGSDADSVGTLRRIWTRDSQGGQWEGHWVLHRPTVTVWDPQEDPEAPEELTEVATLMQRIWRGYRVRRGSLPVAPAPAPAPALPPPDLTPEEEAAVAALVKLRDPPADSWIMQRMLRVD